MGRNYLLPRGIYPSALAIALLLALGMLLTIGVPVHAACSSPPSVPFMISGTLTLNGSPAVSTRVTATVDGVDSGFTTGAAGNFITTVKCGSNGQTVTFAVDGYEIVETASYQVGNFVPATVNLSDSAATFTETVTPTTGTPVTATLGNGAPGVVIAATGGNMGSTKVVVKPNQDCTTVAGETVARCFNITPTVSTAGNLTFYFYADQIPGGQTCDNMEVFHWGGSGWTQVNRDTTYATSGRDCTSDPHSIRVTASTFSPFVIKAGGTPTTVTLAGFTASTSTQDRTVGLLILAMALLAGVGFSVLARHRNETRKEA